MSIMPFDRKFTPQWHAQQRRDEWLKQFLQRVEAEKKRLPKTENPLKCRAAICVGGWIGDTPCPRCHGSGYDVRKCIREVRRLEGLLSIQGLVPLLERYIKDLPHIDVDSDSHEQIMACCDLLLQNQRASVEKEEGATVYRVVFSDLNNKPVSGLAVWPTAVDDYQPLAVQITNQDGEATFYLDKDEPYQWYCEGGMQGYKLDVHSEEDA